MTATINFNDREIDQIIRGRKTRHSVLVGANDNYKSLFPGAIIWVREKHLITKQDFKSPRIKLEDGRGYLYYCHGWNLENKFKGKPPSWITSVKMPKEAARVFIVTEGTEVVMLQNIRFDTALKEGVEMEGGQFYSGIVHDALNKEVPHGSATDAYAELWNHDHKRSGGAIWTDNPPVRAIEFRLLEVKHVEFGDEQS